MARGMKAATWVVAVKDGEFRQSKAGNDFGIVNIVVNDGKTDDAGKEISSYIKVLLFATLANEARQICKGDRAYTEGTLSASAYSHESGPRVDLTIKAFKFERTQIGKNRPRRENGNEIPASAFAGPEPREKPRIQGRDFGDAIPF